MKNLHIIAFTTQQNPKLQFNVQISENVLTNINIGQGVSILDTLILDGGKLCAQLNDPVLEEVKKIEEETKLKEETQETSIKKMVTGMEYLAEKYGSALEQKHILNLKKKVYEAHPTVTG